MQSLDPLSHASFEAFFFFFFLCVVFFMTGHMHREVQRRVGKKPKKERMEAKKQLLDSPLVRLARFV